MIDYTKKQNGGGDLGPSLYIVSKDETSAFCWFRHGMTYNIGQSIVVSSRPVNRILSP